MCRGLPGRVISTNGFVAEVDFWGTVRRIQLEIVDEDVAPGDYVLCHLGYAVRRIPEDDVALTMALFDDVRPGGVGHERGV